MLEKLQVSLPLSIVYITAEDDDRRDAYHRNRRIALIVSTNYYRYSILDFQETQSRKLDPQLLQTIALKMYKQREIARLRNQLTERQEAGDFRDADDSLLQLITDWMRREEMKRKRAHRKYNPPRRCGGCVF